MIEKAEEIRAAAMEARQFSAAIVAIKEIGVLSGIRVLPQHFKFEHEHTIVALSPEEVRMRLAEARGKLLDAGIDLEALHVVEALPAPESKSGEG